MKSSDKNIAIIGAGIIGLSTAYYLTKEGWKITVISDQDGGASYGNAGHICPSHIQSLAAPGNVKSALSWMINPKSPFFIKPRFNLELIRWSLLFLRRGAKRYQDGYSNALHELAELSRGEYKALCQTLSFSSLNESGILTAYLSEKGSGSEEKTAALAQRLGQKVEKWDKSQIDQITPGHSNPLIGGQYYPNDASLDPGLLMESLKTFLLSQGVEFVSKAKVTEVSENSSGEIELIAGSKRITSQKVLIACGAWSPELWPEGSSKLPMQAAKGYSFDLTNNGELPFPVIFSEGKVVVTPMGKLLRVAGTLELSGFSNGINHKRIEGILETLKRNLPGLKTPSISELKIWSGFRPLSADGLPYLGKNRLIPNLYIAAGHAMLGLSLGPGTGLLMAQLIREENPSISLKAFDPYRFD